MNTFTYTVTATPAATGKTFNKTQSLTGSTDVTFSLAALSGYDVTTTQKMNKVIVDFDWEDEELVIVRPLSGSTIQSLTGETFSRVLETEFTDKQTRFVYLTIYRDDGQVDVVQIKFTMHKPPISTYENVNLLKTDYFNNDVDDEKLLLTFINKNPEVLGLGLLDIDVPGKSGFDPSLTTSPHVSSNSFNVGFTTEYVHVQASESNTKGNIRVRLEDIIDTNTGLPKENGKISLKWRTRALDPDNNGAVALPNNPSLFYIPLTANSSFAHLSGYLSWNCGDLLKDIDLSTKTITIPLIDITGTRTNLTDYYFTNVNVGLGTSLHGFASGGYFLLDLYDSSSCDTITTTTSTITAFVNY